jgi:hypothetical protein
MSSISALDPKIGTPTYLAESEAKNSSLKIHLSLVAYLLWSASAIVQGEYQYIASLEFTVLLIEPNNAFLIKENCVCNSCVEPSSFML